MPAKDNDVESVCRGWIFALRVHNYAVQCAIYPHDLINVQLPRLIAVLDKTTDRTTKLLTLGLKTTEMVLPGVHRSDY